jgi:hypothetical protein
MVGSSCFPAGTIVSAQALTRPSGVEMSLNGVDVGEVAAGLKLSTTLGTSISVVAA